jgi:hypothetical protein
LDGSFLLGKLFPQWEGFFIRYPTKRWKALKQCIISSMIQKYKDISSQALFISMNNPLIRKGDHGGMERNYTIT